MRATTMAAPVILGIGILTFASEIVEACDGCRMMPRHSRAQARVVYTPLPTYWVGHPGLMTGETHAVYPCLPAPVYHAQPATPAAVSPNHGATTTPTTDEKIAALETRLDARIKKLEDDLSDKIKQAVREAFKEQGVSPKP